MRAWLNFPYRAILRRYFQCNHCVAVNTASFRVWALRGSGRKDFSQNASVNHLVEDTNAFTGQSVSQLQRRTVSLVSYRSMPWSFKPAAYSVGQSVGRLVGHSVSRLVGHKVSWSLGQSVTRLSVSNINWPRNWLVGQLVSLQVKATD